MRAVRIEVIHEEDKLPLVLRARRERTFLGLGLFVAGVLLAGGAYLLTEAFREPLQSSGVSVVVAGLALSLGAFAAIYLAWPRRHLAIAHRQELGHFDDEWKSYVLTAYGESVQRRAEVRQTMNDPRNLPGPM